MPRVLRATAALAAAVVVSVLFALPPGQRSAATPFSDSTIPGAFHVHTNRSDGRSSPEAIAAAAAQAGLKFVVFTDHGDGTRKPDPPTYRSGVLCIDAVEISTDDGHLIALGLGAAPYRLAGEGRDVVEDVRRLGGTAVAAHPDSPREGLRWRDSQVPLDGFEIINLDTVWRRHLEPIGWRTTLTAVRDLATYLVRPGETIAAMATDQTVDGGIWQDVSRWPGIALFGGVDAHARLDLQDREPETGSWSVALPGYEAVFRTLTTRVRLAQPLDGEPNRDADAILAALREGRSYSAMESVLAPPAFEFFASAAGERADEGQELRTSSPAALTIRTNAPPSFTTIVWRNGTVLAEQASTAEWVLPLDSGSAAYRAVIVADWPNRPAWLFSNPIFVRSPEADGAASAAAADAGGPPTNVPGETIAPERWSTEASADAKVALDVGVADGRPELRMRFGLPPGQVRDQYVAAVLPLDQGLTTYRGLSFAVRSSQPMRGSIQLRVPGMDGSPRWRRSFYSDEEWRTHVFDFRDFRAAGAVPAPQAPLSDVRSLLVVIDQINTVPGTSGRVWIADVALR